MPYPATVTSSPTADNTDAVYASRPTSTSPTGVISGSVTSGNFCGYINQIDRRSYYTLHFYAVFDKPFSRTGTWRDSSLSPNSTTASGGTTYG